MRYLLSLALLFALAFGSRLTAAEKPNVIIVMTDEAKADPKATGAVVVAKLPAGKTTLKAWFSDADGKDLCGAFFVTVVKK